MDLKVLELVQDCNTAAEGAVVYEAVRAYIAKGQHITLSFSGADSVPSSFVNASIVRLVEELGFDQVRKSLAMVNCTPQVTDMLRRCIRNAATSMAA
ncbi:MAG TPA: STAS-like domain-containing protein [Allosphingosinicella sp.]|jgi:chitinase